MTEDNESLNGIPRIEARQRVRDAKDALLKHSRKLYGWATEDLDDSAPIDDLLRHCMASVLLAEVNLGTDDEPSFTTKVVQILRLLLANNGRLLTDLSLGRDASDEISQLDKLAEQAQRILAEQD